MGTFQTPGHNTEDRLTAGSELELLKDAADCTLEELCRKHNRCPEAVRAIIVEEMMKRLQLQLPNLLRTFRKTHELPPATAQLILVMVGLVDNS